MKKAMWGLKTHVINTLTSLLIGGFVSLFLLQTPMVVIDPGAMLEDGDRRKLNLRLENRGASVAQDVTLRWVVGQVAGDEFRIVHEGISPGISLNAGESFNLKSGSFDMEQKEAVIYLDISSRDSVTFRHFIRQFTGNPYHRSRWAVYRPTVDRQVLYYFSRFSSPAYKKQMITTMDRLRDMVPVASPELDELAL